jgi:hypothetical protein
MPVMGDLFPGASDPAVLVSLSMIGAATILGLSIIGGLLILAYTQNQPQTVSSSYGRDSSGNLTSSVVNVS